MTKKFFVQVQCDERTRMLSTDDDLAESMQVLLGGFFATWTSGSKPAVKVRCANVLLKDAEIP